MSICSVKKNNDKRLICPLATSDWINPSISQSKSPSPQTSETQLRAIKTTEDYLLFLPPTEIKIFFFQLFKAENIDLNVYSHFQKQNNKEQLWYNLKNLKNVNSVSVNNKQTNKKSCKFDYGNIFILFIILSFQREAATEKLITPLGWNQQTCGREKCDWA